MKPQTYITFKTRFAQTILVANLLSKAPFLHIFNLFHFTCPIMKYSREQLKFEMTRRLQFL